MTSLIPASSIHQACQQKKSVDPSGKNPSIWAIYGLEKLVRQMEHLSMKKLIPKFAKYVYRPCTSLYSLGLVRKVAGLFRRPIMQYQAETAHAVWEFGAGKQNK